MNRVRPPITIRRSLSWATACTAVLVAWSCLTGCHVYQFGAASLYRSDVTTIHVPIIESDSLRRNLGERLTEAVVKQLESRTTYRIVGLGDDADSQLKCRIVMDSKRVATETRTDEPRLVDLIMMVQFEWTDRQGRTLLQRNEVPLPSELLQVTDNGLMVAEIGQSIATTQQKAIDRIATQIVDQMEAAW